MGLALLAAWTASAGTGTETEIEPNDSFATRQILGPRDRVLSASITDVLAVPDANVPLQLFPQTVVPFILPGENPGDPFIAWIDNDPLLNEMGPDTLLGSLDAMNDLVAFDDDSSPVGTGTASALLGAVNSDGTIKLSVTGSPDTTFTGAHTEQGEFDLLVKLGELDLDFYSYQGLEPNEPFSLDVEVPDNAGLLKTLLLLDDSGVPIETVFNAFPLNIVGVVPASGVLNFAVTGGEDRNADGIPDTGPGTDSRIGIGLGPYTLVPEPGGTALAMTAMAMLTVLRRRSWSPGSPKL